MTHFIWMILVLVKSTLSVLDASFSRVHAQPYRLIGAAANRVQNHTRRSRAEKKRTINCPVLFSAPPQKICKNFFDHGMVGAMISVKRYDTFVESYVKLNLRLLLD